MICLVSCVLVDFLLMLVYKLCNVGRGVAIMGGGGGGGVLP